MLAATTNQRHISKGLGEHFGIGYPELADLFQSCQTKAFICVILVAAVSRLIYRVAAISLTYGKPCICMNGA